MATFRVLRHMEGDKSFAPGDTRELSEADAARLVASGALEAVKATTAPANKALAAAPANKAVPRKPARRKA